MVWQLLALLSFAVFAQGALIYAPVPTRATAANDVVAFILQNPTNGSLAPYYLSFGHPFYVSQLNLLGENSSIVTAYRTDAPTTTIEVQVDAKAFHVDGSVRQATLTLLTPTLAANSSVQFMLTRSVRKVAALALSALPNSVLTLKIDRIFNSSSTYTYDPSNLVKSSNNFWLSGDLAVQARVERWVMKAMRVVFDVTLYKDNSWCVDVILSNDIAMGPEGGNITYDATITSTPFTQVYSSLNHFQYAGWHKFVCSKGESKVNVQYDQLNFIQSRAVHPVNFTIGTDDGAIAGETNEMKAPTWGVPFSNNGVSMYMPGTGDRRDIGALPIPHVLWFASQSADAKKYMMGWGDASHAVPWNYYLNVTGRYLNFWDYPNIWTDYRGNPKPTQPGEGNGWAPETAHHPCLASLPYIVSGQRYYLDLAKSIGAFVIVSVWNEPRANWIKINYVPQDKGLLAPYNQLRGLAWQLRDLGWAAWLSEPSDPWHQRYFNDTLSVNLNFMLNNETTRFSKFQGEASGWWPGVYPTGYHPPWQDDHLTNVLSMLAMQGSSDARSIMLWQRNFQIMSFFDNRWNNWNRLAYNIGIGPDNNCSTYDCLQTYTVLAGQNVSNLQALGGNYGQLARQTFILFQVVFRDDQDAKNALAKIAANNVQYTSDASYPGDPRNNPGVFPNPPSSSPTSSPSTVPPSSSSSSSPSSSTSRPSSTSSSSSAPSTGAPTNQPSSATAVSVSVLFVLSVLALL